jgi:rod shape-determining protein MreC
VAGSRTSGARGPRSRFVLAVVVLSSLTLLALGNVLGGARGRARDSFRPVRSVGDALTDPLDSAIGRATSFRDIKAENARLREALDAARADQLRYADAVRERDALLRLGKFRNPAGYTSVGARVISMGGSNVEDKIEIDVGTRDGVRPGAPVVTEAGLVGRVLSATAGYSVVALVTDPESSVGVRVAASGEVGFARGQRVGAPMVVELLAPDTKLEKGDVLVTNGLQRAAFPPSIPVGRVRSVRPGSIQLDVELDPVVDLSTLSFVKVLLERGVR